MQASATTSLNNGPITYPATALAVLNGMAGEDIAESIVQQRAWGLRYLDLKDRIFGQGIADLTPAQGEDLVKIIASSGMQVHTFSTGIGYGVVEQGERAFRAAYAEPIERILRLIPLLKPTQVRLLAAQTDRRAELCQAIDYIADQHPWLFAWYRETCDRITAAGSAVVIENEVGTCCLANPQEVLALHQAIARPALRQIWDIVNLWQMGTYPSVEVYRQLAPLIGMVHLKGGRSAVPGGTLKWCSQLETASWPLREVVTAILAEQQMPVICLNPPHGEAHPDYRGDYVADINFLRTTFSEICS